MQASTYYAFKDVRSKTQISRKVTHMRSIESAFVFLMCSMKSHCKREVVGLMLFSLLIRLRIFGRDWGKVRKFAISRWECHMRPHICLLYRVGKPPFSAYKIYLMNAPTTSIDLHAKGLPSWNRVAVDRFLSRDPWVELPSTRLPGNRNGARIMHNRRISHSPCSEYS